MEEADPSDRKEEDAIISDVQTAREECNRLLAAISRTASDFGTAWETFDAKHGDLMLEIDQSRKLIEGATAELHDFKNRIRQELQLNQISKDWSKRAEEARRRFGYPAVFSLDFSSSRLSWVGCGQRYRRRCGD